MKTSLKFPLILLILSAGMIFQTGCKKYEEGPALSLRSKKARVANTWRIEKAEVNGFNVTELYEEVIVKLEKSGAFSMTTPFGNTTGSWDFDSDKEAIVITETTGEVYSWKILKLKEKELWVVEESDGERTEIHLAE